MQFSITKTLALAGFIMSAAMVQAQFKISKISNGTKTALKNGDVIEIHVSEDDKALENIVVELDIAAFKKTYKYDAVTIGYQRGGYYSGYYTHTFDSQLNLKKYAGKGVIPVYAFDTKNFKETDFRTLVTPTFEYSPYEAKQERQIVVYGTYITGEEGYFDNNDIYKTRDVHSAAEPLATIKINVTYNAKRMLDNNYDNAVRRMNSFSDDFNRSVKENITQYVAPYVATPLYGALADGFDEVWAAKIAAVKAESDKQKMIDAVVQLEQDFELMRTVSVKDKSVLKTMNKAIKEITTTEQKWELIKANA